MAVMVTEVPERIGFAGVTLIQRVKLHSIKVP
jgi:hypothetical protein